MLMLYNSDSFAVVQFDLGVDASRPQTNARGGYAPFRVEIAGRTWFGNCIWDALGIVAMLGGTGRVSTWCPDCRDPLVVTVDQNRLSSGTGVAHFAVPALHWWDDIGFN